MSHSFPAAIHDPRILNGSKDRPQNNDHNSGQSAQNIVLYLPGLDFAYPAAEILGHIGDTIHSPIYDPQIKFARHKGDRLPQPTGSVYNSVRRSTSHRFQKYRASASRIPVSATIIDMNMPLTWA